MNDSKEKFLSALLAEDARLPDNAPDQELLDDITSEIEASEKIIPLWKKPEFRASIAACAVFGLVLTGAGLWKIPLGTTDKETVTEAGPFQVYVEEASKLKKASRDMSDLADIRENAPLASAPMSPPQVNTPATVNAPTEGMVGRSQSNGFTFKAQAGEKEVTLEEGMTLQSAIAAAGGAGTFDSKKKASIIRNGKTYEYDLRNENHRNIRINSNDTISLTHVNSDSHLRAMFGSNVAEAKSSLKKKEAVAPRAENMPDARITMKPAMEELDDVIVGSDIKAIQQKSLARHNSLVDQPFKSPAESPLSTFSIDTDRASYTNLRNNINRGIHINPDSVRIEELINAFPYDYAPPTGDHPFSVNVETAACPWNAETRLVKIGLKGKEIQKNARPAANLVLLCDVSGSMNSPHKLGYLKTSFMQLVENLDERDTVSIVTYAGSEGIALSPTVADEEGRRAIFNAIETLQAGGGTNGEAGIKLAYKLARSHYKEGGINRVLLATDGDFNVGVTGDEELLNVVKTGAKSGSFLTVLGFGYDNLNDGMLEKVTNDGNGQYFFIDSQQEGHRVFSKELTGTLMTIAKDVKIQVEFNPAEVAEYRLLGYANRELKDEDFNNDRVDAGEIGAGHTVTALYEFIPGTARPAIDQLKYGNAGDLKKGEKRSPLAQKPAETDAELLTVKLRYKKPEGTKSTLTEHAVKDSGKSFSSASADFRFSSSVALYGMLLRNAEHTGGADFSTVQNIVKSSLKEESLRKEFLELVEKTPR